MIKCTNKDCRFKIEDTVLAGEDVTIKRNYYISRNICPKCEHELKYVNELQVKVDKYKKSMNLK